MAADLEKEKLLLENAKKDKSKFDKIYNYFYKDVYRFTYSLTFNQEDTEDIVSNTFLKFYEKLDSYEWSGISIKSWLFTTARFLVYNKNRQPFHESYNDDIDPSNYYEISFVDEVINKDLLNRVKSEIEKLAIHEREIVILRVWEDMAFKDIAAIQEITENSCKLRFYRAIEKLKKKMEEQKVYGVMPLPLLFTSIKTVSTESAFNPSIPNWGSILGTSSSLGASSGSAFLKTLSTFLYTKAGLTTISITTVVLVAAGGFGINSYIASQNNNRLLNNNDDKLPTVTISSTIASTSTPTPSLTATPTATPTNTPTSTPTSAPTRVPTATVVATQRYQTFSNASVTFTFDSALFTNINNTRLRHKASNTDLIFRTGTARVNTYAPCTAFAATTRNGARLHRAPNTGVNEAYLRDVGGSPSSCQLSSNLSLSRNISAYTTIANNDFVYVRTTVFDEIMRSATIR